MGSVVMLRPLLTRGECLVLAVVAGSIAVLAMIGAWWVVYETVRILMPVMIWLDK